MSKVPSMVRKAPKRGATADVNKPQQADDPAASNIMLSHHEIVTLILKEKGIHEGLWTSVITLTFGALNVGMPGGDAFPTGLVGVQAIGIGKGEVTNNLTVDAAVVNPRTKPKKS